LSHLSEPCDLTNVQVVTRSGLPTDVAVRPANTEQNIVSQSSGADFEGVTVSDVVAGDESRGCLVTITLDQRLKDRIWQQQNPSSKRKIRPIPASLLVAVKTWQRQFLPSCWNSGEI